MIFDRFSFPASDFVHCMNQGQLVSVYITSLLYNQASDNLRAKEL